MIRRIFLDTEWTAAPWSERSELMWIGLADEQGRSWYGISSEVEIDPSTNPFIFGAFRLVTPDEPRLSRAQIAAAVVDFCGEVDEFWAWIPTVDRFAEWFGLGDEASSKTVRVITYPEYYRRTPSIPSKLPHPWLHLCLPASQSVEFGNKVFSTPAEIAFSSVHLFSVWKTDRIKRPLTRVPSEDLAVRFQLLRRPPASFTDVGALVAMNRALYERARDIGGTRLTTTALPFSQADWRQYYGPAWESLRTAKQRFDPNNVLAPGQGIFPS